MKPAYVLGLGLWTPCYDSPSRWGRSEAHPAVLKPVCEILPQVLRRATSLTTLMGAEVIGQALARLDLDRSSIRFVFGSAYGEIQIAIAQMEMMESADGRLSPSCFKHSVHNTTVGLVSIALQNRMSSTALAAGPDTFGMGLLEALAGLDSEGGIAVVSVADEAPGPPFDTFADFAPLGLGLCLASEPLGGTSSARLSWVGRAACGEPEVASPLSEELARNPVAAGLPLFSTLLAPPRNRRVPLALAVANPFCVEVSWGSTSSGEGYSQGGSEQ